LWDTRLWCYCIVKLGLISFFIILAAGRFEFVIGS
jgi:hypothetical protein